MKRIQKKYEILPGVPTPDFKTIVDAASDYSTTGVEGVEVRRVEFEAEESERFTPTVTTGAVANELNKLGAQVSANEAKEAQERKRKMEAIKQRAVSAPESMSDLRKAAAERMSDEQREDFAQKIAEEEQQIAEQEAKQKAREERKQMQQKALEDSLARKAAKEQEIADKVAQYEKELRESEKQRQKEAAAKAKEEPTVATDEETLDDFSEFL